MLYIFTKTLKRKFKIFLKFSKSFLKCFKNFLLFSKHYLKFSKFSQIIKTFTLIFLKLL